MTPIDTQESMKYLIDWQLNREAFRHQVRDMIHKAQKNGKVIALPMETSSGMTFLNLMTLILAQVNCDGCDALCCKNYPQNEPIGLLPPEHKCLAEKYGNHHFIIKGEEAFLPLPCPFLKNNRCTIYRERPLVCVLYPFQPGATDGDGRRLLALGSSCPEARRITKQVYMMSWRIRQQFSLLGEENFMKRIK